MSISPMFWITMEIQMETGCYSGQIFAMGTEKRRVQPCWEELGKALGEGSSRVFCVGSTQIW